MNLKNEDDPKKDVEKNFTSGMENLPKGYRRIKEDIETTSDKT